MAGEFIQPIAASWQVCRLDEVATVIDSLHKTPTYSETGRPMVRVTDVQGGFLDVSKTLRVTEDVFQEFTRRYAPKRGDIVFSRVGSYGNASYANTDIPFCLGQNTALLSPRINGRFLHLFLQSTDARWQIEQVAVGSTQKTISLKSISALTIPIPPAEELEAIAHILGTLDDKIQLNRRMNETLEAMARALFQSWFVDFDPVRAKHALSKIEGGEDRPSASSGQAFPDLPKPLADLFPDSFEDSELGEIPKGWEVKTIEEIAARVGMGPFGSSIKVESFVQKGVPVISGQHLRGFMVEDTTFNFVTQEHAERLKAANVRRGDVVFTHAGNIGQVAYIPGNSRYDCYVLSQRQFFMRCDPAQVTPCFVAFYFGSPEGRHQLLANASSSGVPSIARPVTYLRSIRLTIPPKPIIDAFEKSVQPLLSGFRRNLSEVSTLMALRDRLLPKLMSGELRVDHAEECNCA